MLRLAILRSLVGAIIFILISLRFILRVRLIVAFVFLGGRLPLVLLNVLSVLSGRIILIVPLMIIGFVIWLLLLVLIVAWLRVIIILVVVATVLVIWVVFLLGLLLLLDTFR